MQGQQFASGELIAQVRPSGTTAVTAYTAILRTEITLMTVAITGGGNVDLEFFVDCRNYHGGDRWDLCICSWK